MTPRHSSPEAQWITRFSQFSRILKLAGPRQATGMAHTTSISDHWGTGDVFARILDAMKRAGIDPDTGEVPNGGEVLAPEDDCVCIYDNLEEKVPFDEAKEFEEQQAEAESGQDIEIPDNIAAIIDDCTSSSGDS